MDSPLADHQSTQSSTQRAYLALRDDIIFGRIPPGERLKIDTLKGFVDHRMDGKTPNTVLPIPGEWTPEGA